MYSQYVQIKTTVYKCTAILLMDLLATEHAHKISLDIYRVVPKK